MFEKKVHAFRYSHASPNSVFSDVFVDICTYHRSLEAAWAIQNNFFMEHGLEHDIPRSHVAAKDKQVEAFYLKGKKNKMCLSN